MDVKDRREERRPATGEAPFALGETFYSRTDGRGVITACNHVFKRVSAFGWDDLIGAPHRIIRHPGMPRGVFHLLWSTVQDGRTMGAYVKNRACDGLHYWVYAIVLPHGQGYISARLKPSSPWLGRITDFYRDLLASEAGDGLTPAASAERIHRFVRDQGFESYHDFAAAALVEELLARDAGLGRSPDPTLDGLRAMAEAAVELSRETSFLIEDFKASTTMPTNMRIIASRLEPTGGPLSMLSKNYGLMSQEMTDWFQANVTGPDSNFSSILPSIRDASFVAGATCILEHCRADLEVERRYGPKIDRENERALLGGIVRDQQRVAADALRRLRLESQRIIGHCDVMRRHAVGLGTTRIMCEIERSRLEGGPDGLRDIIAQMAIFQDNASERLKRIATLGRIILSQAEHPARRDLPPRPAPVAAQQADA